jgi:hypothetical protein
LLSGQSDPQLLSSAAPTPYFGHSQYDHIAPRRQLCKRRCQWIEIGSAVQLRLAGTLPSLSRLVAISEVDNIRADETQEYQNRQYSEEQQRDHEILPSSSR